MDYSKAIILSGEGERGVCQRHTGRATLRAVNRRLNKERCGGDRWARAFLPAGPEYEDGAYIEIDQDGNFLDFSPIPATITEKETP